MLEWKNCSVHENAQDLIAWMLHPKPAERCTANQALEHQWLTGKGHTHNKNTDRKASKNREVTMVRRKLQKAVTKMAIIEKWSYMIKADKTQTGINHKVS